MTQTISNDDVAQSAFNAYMIRARKYPLLNGEQEIALTKLVKLGGTSGERARQIMITSNLRFVVSVAWKQVRDSVSLEDLVQEGNIGLMKAVEKFDEERGFRFATYARWWIHQAIKLFLDANGHAVRLPSHSSTKIGLMNRVMAKLSRDGHKPTEQEVARVMGVSVDTVRDLAEYAAHPISMNSPLGDGEGSDGETEVGDLIEDAGAANPEASAIEGDFKAKITACLDKLTPRERDVIVLRFGLEGHDEQTLEEVGQKYRCTREWIRQIEAKALEKLRGGESGRVFKALR